MNIDLLLRSHESKTLEFKRDLSSADGVLRTLVSFSNTSGGVLVLGVDDKTKNVLGILDPFLTEEKLASLISDCIAPRMVPEIEIHPWRQTYLIVVQVYPSPVRPHYIKKLGQERGIYIRVGSTNRTADSAMIDELRRSVMNKIFDEQPMPEVNSEAIDRQAASELFSKTRDLKAQDFETLGIFVPYGKGKVPTVGGVLLFGRTRENYFPYAYIQAGRFSGIDKSQIADNVEIKTHLPIAVDRAMDFLKKHANKAIIIRNIAHEEKWSVPMDALREAIINALVHADYSQQSSAIRLAIFDDRIEVENPGLLPFGLTIEDILQGVSKARNRVIGRVFHRLGLIEKWGSGIRRMLTSCLEGGFPEPKFEELGTHFRVTFPLSKMTEKMDLDLKDHKILQLLKNPKGKSTHEIAQAIQLSSRATRSRMAKLIERGLVSEIGMSKQDPKRRFHLK